MLSIFNLAFFQDYMDDVHGKEIVLSRTTVKVPGQRPRGSRPAMPMTNPNLSGNDINNLSGRKIHLIFSFDKIGMS